MQITIEYPALLPDALQQTRADFEQEAKMATASGCLRWDNSHLAQQPDWQAFPGWFSLQAWPIMEWIPFV
jgi:hypothetical protein